MYENLQEKYRHVHSSYEQRTKETQDLQGKVIELEKKVIELDAFRPNKMGESSRVQLDPSMKWAMVTHIHQGQLPPIAKKKSKVEED